MWRRRAVSSSRRSVFFFSSRRRHTRSLCDWSSDVCSSDLDAAWKFNLFTAEKFAQDLEGKLRINMPVLKTSAADTQGWLATPPANMRLKIGRASCRERV